MRLIRRRPRLLPLQLPRLDGTSWPDRREVGRDSFAASTLYQLGYREAFSPEAHDITDLLLDQVVPILGTDAAPEDEPNQRGVFSAAGQVGGDPGVHSTEVHETNRGASRGSDDATCLDACTSICVHECPKAMPSTSDEDSDIAFDLVFRWS